VTPDTRAWILKILLEAQLDSNARVPYLLPVVLYIVCLAALSFPSLHKGVHYHYLIPWGWGAGGELNARAKAYRDIETDLLHFLTAQLLRTIKETLRTEDLRPAPLGTDVQGVAAHAPR
jgi:hypothetical protein